MTTKVTKESLAAKIKVLEEVKLHYGFMSIEQEYQLKAYRMLIDLLPFEYCDHDWKKVGVAKHSNWVCSLCGKAYKGLASSW